MRRWGSTSSSCHHLATCSLHLHLVLKQLQLLSVAVKRPLSGTMSCSCEQLDLDSTSEPETEVAPTMAWHGQAPIANAIPIPDNTNAEHMHKYITNWCVIGVRTPLSSLVSLHSSQVTLLLLPLLALLWLANSLPSRLTYPKRRRLHHRFLMYSTTRSSSLRSFGTRSPRRPNRNRRSPGRVGPPRVSMRAKMPSTFWSTAGSPPFDPDLHTTINTNEPYQTVSLIFFSLMIPRF